MRPPGLTHRAITRDLLDQIPDHELEPEIFDYVLAAAYAETEIERLELLRGLSKGFRAIYTTWVLEGEVFNGGFSQFFSNSSGVLVYEARDGYWLVHACQHAQIVIDAIELERNVGTFDSTLPDSATYRGDDGQRPYQPDYQYTDFSEIEDRLYNSTEPINNFRIRYIREHPGQFVGPAIG